MKVIEYTAQYNNARRDPVIETFTVRARNISSGIRKALDLALKSMPGDWELCAIAFSQVKS